jgi:hypothetical protein
MVVAVSLILLSWVATDEQCVYAATVWLPSLSCQHRCALASAQTARPTSLAVDQVMENFTTHPWLLPKFSHSMPKDQLAGKVSSPLRYERLIAYV